MGWREEYLIKYIQNMENVVAIIASGLESIFLHMSKLCGKETMSEMKNQVIPSITCC